MLDPGNSIQVSRDHTLPLILHQAGSWKCQLDKEKHPLYQGTSIQGGTDNPQTWSDLLGRERHEEKEAELARRDFREGLLARCEHELPLPFPISS